MNGVLHLSDGQKIRLSGHQTAQLKESLGGTELPVEFLVVVDANGVHHKVKTECIVSLEYRQTQISETRYRETTQYDEAAATPSDS
jgi:hypothetical protein